METKATVEIARVKDLNQDKKIAQVAISVLKIFLQEQNI